jgi:hypothetical protein
MNDHNNDGCYFAETPWTWRERLRFKLMPTRYCTVPDGPFLDCVVTTTIVGLSFVDRLRVLLTGHLRVETKTATEYIVGDCKTACVSYPIFKPERS